VLVCGISSDQLGGYNAQLIEAILTHIAPALERG
jgi:hypothetical protein